MDKLDMAGTCGRLALARVTVVTEKRLSRHQSINLIPAAGTYSKSAGELNGLGANSQDLISRRFSAHWKWLLENEDVKVEDHMVLNISFLRT